MIHKKIIALLILVGIVSLTRFFLLPSPIDARNETTATTVVIPKVVLIGTTTSLTHSLVPHEETDIDEKTFISNTDITDAKEVLEQNKKSTQEVVKKSTNELSPIYTVPFYSQFTDITSEVWKNVGCGIASLAMVIEFYNPGSVTVDTLLEEGIDADAYLDSAGWTYAGLIGLTTKYGLSGKTHDMAGTSMETAFNEMKSTLENGPIMASVHYTFDPKNPIPHLVVINGVKNGMVYYNDPAEKGGGGSITISKFQKSWKKRYIEIRPLS